jgi:hypothetical protein
MYSFGTKVVRMLVVLAGAAGVMIFYAVEGGSLVAALVIAGFITGGTLLVAWWLMRKTGLNREWSATRSDGSRENDENSR